MRANNVLGLAATIIACTVGCSSHSAGTGEATSSDEQALTVYDSQSVPYPAIQLASGEVKNVWTGSPGELVVADALASCTAKPAATAGGAATPQGDWVTDAALRDLRAKMASTLAQPLAQPATSWLDLRAKAQDNARPISKVFQAAPLTPKFPAAYDLSTFVDSGVWGHGDLAQRALDVAAVNYCVARSLDEQMRFGWNLLMPAADQRLLLETVRERAQIAMLQLSDIAVALQSNDLTDLSAFGAVYGLRSFAALGVGPSGVAPADVIAGWAKDLTDSVRLHVTATEKLTRLLGRSASAHESLPGAADVGSNDDYGPGSWRQRMLALLYGGNPLDGTGNPGAPAAVKSDPAAAAIPWPSAAELPYAPQGVWTPGAMMFLNVAQQNDALTLLLKSGSAGYTGPGDVDVTAAGEWLYRDVEAKLKTKQCVPVVGVACPPSAPSDCVPIAPVACSAVSPTSITAPIPYSTGATPNVASLDGWLSWQLFQLRPEDARDLVAAFVSVLPSVTAAGGFHIMGSTNLVTLPGRAAPSLHFDRDAHFVPRSLLETASVYGKMGRHRIPALLLDSAVMDAVYYGAADGGSDGSVLDGTRAMGAVPALAALRESLQIVGGSKSPAEKGFQSEAKAIGATLGAAIGDSQVSLRPVEDRFVLPGQGSIFGYTTAVHAAGAPTPGGAPTRRWAIRVLPGSGDAFWSDAPSAYAVYAVSDTPRLINMVADPASTKAGFGTVASILAQTNGTVFTAAALSKDATGTLATNVTLPEGKSVVLVARHRTKRGIEYRALTGTVSPAAVRQTQPDGSTLALPGDSQFFVTSGDFTDMAAQATAVTGLDPASPAYDGFGQPRAQLANRAALTDTNPNASISEYVTQWLSVSKAQTDGAYNDHLAPLLGDLAKVETDHADLAAAKARELGSIQDTLSKLCGPSGGLAGSSNASESASADAACHIEFVTVDSMGPVASELAAWGCPDPSAPATRPAPSWLPPAAPYDCKAPADPANTADPLACSLASVRGIFSFPVQVAKPVACAAWRRTSPFGTTSGGQIAQLLSDQLKAYWDYRDAVSVLEATGLSNVALAHASDEGRVLAAKQLDAENARIAANVTKETQDLRKLSQTVADDDKTVQEKAQELSDLTGTDVKKILSAIAGGAALAATGAGLVTVGTAVATGAAAGSVIPGWGTVIGAAAGLIVGAWLALTGPSQEQIDQATDAVSQAQRALDAARAEEADLAGYYGLCNSAPQAPSPKWGACPNAPLGTLMAEYNAEELVSEQQQSVARAQQLVALRQGEAELKAKLATVWSSASLLGSSSIVIRNAVQSADLDLERAKLENRLVVQSTRADFGIMEAFHSNELFITQAQLELSRLKLIEARRVLEFVYATDFSTSGQAISAQVAAPKLWIDQVYEYDLLPLRAIGGQTGAPRAGVDPKKLQNFEINLETLRDQYLTANNVLPSAQPAQSTYVPGPRAVLAFSGAPDPTSGDWRVLCPSGSACAPGGGYCQAPISGSFSAVCAPPAGSGLPDILPLSAKVQFTLNRWGRAVGTHTDTQALKLLNGRWNRLAVNIMSDDDLKTCSSSTPGCGQTTTLHYTVTELGPYVTTGADAQLRSLPFSSMLLTGVAYGGKSEIDVTDPTQMQNIARFERPELIGSPLGGLYEIEIASYTPEGFYADLGKIRDLQLIVEPLYWQAK